MPWDVAYAETLLSEIWQLPMQSVSERLLENLRQLVGNSKMMPEGGETAPARS